MLLPPGAQYLRNLWGSQVPAASARAVDHRRQRPAAPMISTRLSYLPRYHCCTVVHGAIAAERLPDCGTHIIYITDAGSGLHCCCIAVFHISYFEVLRSTPMYYCCQTSGARCHLYCCVDISTTSRCTLLILLLAYNFMI